MKRFPSKPETESSKRTDEHRKTLYSLLSKHGHDFLMKNGIDARKTINAHVKAEIMKRHIKNGKAD
jgi:hypothetical protein